MRSLGCNSGDSFQDGAGGLLRGGRATEVRRAQPLFEGAVYRRMVADMGPVRASKTVVKTFATDGDCAQLGSLLVNEVAACTPGEPNACLDQLALSSRVKAVRLYK